MVTHRPWYRTAWDTITDIAPSCSGCLLMLVVLWALVAAAAKVVVAIALHR